MKTRVVKNWKTSLLGIILLVVSVILVYLKILTGGEFIALLPTTIGLLCVPDSIFKKWRKSC
jgi:Na+-transporting methylmalonyl-CoA/oxaloacetate decarboxylase beta subunit